MPSLSCIESKPSTVSSWPDAPAGVEWAYRWFAENEGMHLDGFPYGKDTPDGAPFPLTAQRGIHKPRGYSHAVSIKTSGSEFYGDDCLVDNGDGTWTLVYCANRKNEGSQGSNPRIQRRPESVLERWIPRRGP